MPDRTDNFERFVKVAGFVAALGTLAFGVWQFTENEKSRDQAAAEQRVAVARKPYLDRQLELYTEAGNAAAVIASGQKGEARRAAEQRFWQLYWGELAMVEDSEVEAAMVQFGRALSNGAPQDVLQICSLRLSHILRRSLSATWGEKLWHSPYGDEPECPA